MENGTHSKKERRECRQSINEAQKCLWDIERINDILFGEKSKEGLIAGFNSHVIDYAKFKGQMGVGMKYIIYLLTAIFLMMAGGVGTFVVALVKGVFSGSPG